MGKKNEINNLFNATLFWDVDFSSLDPEKNSRLIIERVFSLGTIDEIKVTIRYYGKNRVVNILENLAYLDPKTLNFVSLLFDKPKNEFRCYSKRLSSPQLWNS
ncbi:DUF6922 domain-containing protein [Hanamia caeni]|jgi:hypothetical protein|uniref:DUF6922 domain-containing protein n=1 Tax=Hanamia caeni TaxID=2294116 RepID=UPI0013149050|nr:hypothetical protein [Hanamia caeni]